VPAASVEIIVSTDSKAPDASESVPDDGTKKFRTYTGTVYWISDKSEFTPKTIPTKEERADLVYAIKVRVPNDGFIKIGMYGQLKF